MKKRILPLEPTLTIAWPENNFLNSMLQTKETGYDWIMNTHIQIYGSIYRNTRYQIDEKRITFFPFGHFRANIYDLCPYIRKYAIPRNYIKRNHKHFCDFVMEAINHGYYVNTRLFEDFRTDVQLIHPCYIYGYDKNSSLIYIADNLENNKYAERKITFAELEHSFYKNPEHNWDSSIFLYELLDHHFECNRLFIYDQIVDYLNSGTGMCYLNRYYCPDTKYKNAEDNGEVYLGIEAYIILYKQLCAAKQEGRIDLRSFAFLADHKKIMYLRSNYLQAHGILNANPQYDHILMEMHRNCKIILNMLIKFNLKPNNLLLEKVEKLLDCILNQDKTYMNYLAEELSGNTESP